MPFLTWVCRCPGSVPSISPSSARSAVRYRTCRRGEHSQAPEPSADALGGLQMLSQVLLEAAFPVL